MFSFLGRKIAPTQQTASVELPYDVIPLILAHLPNEKLREIVETSKRRNYIWLFAQQVYRPNLLATGPKGKVLRFCTVREISAEGNCRPYQSELEMYSGDWFPCQGLHSVGPLVDDEDVWEFTNPNAGTTWRTYTKDERGFLVVDLLRPRVLALLCVWQMYSDGKCTHIQFFSHPCLDDRCPTAADAGWQAMGPEALVGNQSERDMKHSLRLTAEEKMRVCAHDGPTKVSVAPVRTRYLRIAARNDGRYDKGVYIEVKGVKAFGPAYAGLPDRDMEPL